MRLHFTPTEHRLLAVLADGLPHPRGELYACLPDELGTLANVRPHLSRLRQKLRPLGQDIVCVLYERRLHYRHVRHLHVKSHCNTKG